ncbi:putative P-type ATPase [Aspergillus nomiae NRRL 13137]|uniref:Cation-transporting ATPase n=1 Tax=Aspergillus nomiae NRRL (strain ATCC 15546 / NRRL 13137 / CBS 260.88 / M93) TaxID=1509407 RepID=A0A0L1ISB0_ASPN3|nr:putative P-type ATPase [Aspergillus nomiae NRRL 13137]KNG82285.1 putative P-type ATPase [Aspergillus nomiae NRRL 13137]
MCETVNDSALSPTEPQVPELSRSMISHRRDSMRSSYSVVSDVEMARHEVFDGPISESIPSSVVSFSHRRNRKDSVVSFTYFRDEEDFVEWPDEDAVDAESEADNLVVGDVSPPNRSVRSSFRSKRPSFSRGSAEDPLLPGRHLSVSSYAQDRRLDSRLNQKIYIESEDLTFVIAGFSTKFSGLVLYSLLCVLSLGFAYLVFRWFPRWRVRLTGKPTPLRICQWVAIEDQWNQFSVCQVRGQAYGRPLSSVFADPDSHSFDEENDPTISFLRYIDFRYLRFFYHPLEDKFCLISGWRDPLWTNAKVMRSGLDADDRDSREQIFGKNLVDIQQKPLLQLLMDEAFHPFYMFQLASLVLWSLDEYYYYAVCIFLISVFSIGATVIETKSTMSRLREISLFECDIRVLRNGFWRSVPSRDLVPGDVFEFSDPSLSQVPCDCILLSGDCIVNESMLTGESVPVSKTPLTDDALKYLNLNAPSVHPNIAKHFLFGGTKVIRARRPHNVDDDDAIALAIVVRTGFLTTKGALVRSMLFPKPSGFKFYRDSFRYISVMAMVAILGFVASLFNFIRLGLSWHLIIVRALDLITIVVPPALPATLTIGTNFALSRLKNQNIFCISPQKVNVGGKLDVICFDKTGTLTEDGLDVLGVRTVNREMRLSDLLSDVTLGSPSASTFDASYDRKKRDVLAYIMATCHSLRIVDGELLGDPLDVKMFQFTGWSYQEGGSHGTEQPDSKFETIMPPIAKPPAPSENLRQSNFTAPLELGILRNFEFVSELRRASVIVRQFGDNGASIFVKGAPESVRAICLPDSLPQDFEDILSQYTHKGYRVIACAARYEQKLSWMKVQKMTRGDAESDLEFVGFIIFENKLKQATTETITELNQAGIRNVMCTGDNILTAVSVARECGMVSKSEQCFIPHIVEDRSHGLASSLCWENVDNPALKLDPSTLMPSVNSTDLDLSIPVNVFNIHNFSLAVSGEVFRWILDFGDETVLQRMLVRTKVFARMSPDEKHELVEKLQSLDYCCGFCGDGANDCGALKAADVGISLSDAEASVAAPFTSRQFDVSCVPTLIREGRAALVTSFCCFKYMSLYSAIQFSTVSFLYTSASNLGDFQFLFIDLVLILPIAIFMGWTGPYPVLSRKRPTADLVSRKVLTPLLGQIVICILVQLVAYKAVQSQPWFKPPEIDLDNSNIENSENTALFLVSCFQYTLASVVLSVGPPFRKPMRSNRAFISVVVVDLIISCYMLFRPSRWVVQIMQLTFLSGNFAISLLALAVGSFIFSCLAERALFPSLARALGRAYVLLRPGHHKKRRRYKVLLEEMQE